MHSYPEIPRVENAPPDLLEDGHLWIQEYVDGAPVRFQVQASGRIRFGDSERVFDGEVPLAYRHAARHVRERLDREALRGALDDLESVVFFGVAAHQCAVEYDWAKTPSFLGLDVWAGENGWLPPDSVAKIYRQLGLRPINALEKEVRAADFDPGRDEIPSSNWYDGPAAGVLLRSKTGQRAKILRPELRGGTDPDPVEATATELAERCATDRLFERLAGELRTHDSPVTVDTLYERAVEGAARECHRRLFRDDREPDLQAFRSEIAALTREYLDERD
ncbi:hypothetical protein BRC82_07455 [Halobacteriales archaeon QS_1_67_19]|nr:MAG: hypothetical protein BRC82_07455 [Halobacteriales archaeon QS_1_67_19]